MSRAWAREGWAKCGEKLRHRSARARCTECTFAANTAIGQRHRAFPASGIRKIELARRLGIPRSNVDRLFDFKHSSRLEHLDAPFAAVGRKLLIGVGEAAKIGHCIRL